VLGCVAQQEGEKIFEKAPYVSMVAGSASYRNLPAMLVQIEAGNKRVTGLDDRETDLTFETEFTARSNAHRATSRSLKAVTSSAPIVWCRIRGVKNAAGRQIPSWRKRARWPTWVIPTSNCWGKNVNALPIR